MGDGRWSAVDGRWAAGDGHNSTTTWCEKELPLKENLGVSIEDNYKTLRKKVISSVRAFH